MTDITPSNIKAICKKHCPSFDGIVNVEPIESGLFNQSFFLRSGGDEWVLRIAPPHDSEFCFYERDMMRQEPEIHALIQERTSIPVANILVYDDSRELIQRDYILMERLPGKALSETNGVDTSRVLKQMGGYLAQVHQITSDKYGYLGAHRPMEPQTDWASAFKIMWNNLIDDIVRVGHYDETESRVLRDLLYKCLKYFDRPVQSCLLHMDIWQQNILVDEEGIATGVLDWDRALWGDPEIEFAVLDYCGISEPAFWEGYGQPRGRSEGSRIRGVFYFLYELQKYIVIRQGRHQDRQGALQYKMQALQFVRQCFGV